MEAALVRRVWGARGARLLAGDAVVLALLAAAVVAASLPRGEGAGAASAEVIVSGEKTATLDLTRDSVHELPGPLGVTRVEVRAGKLRVLSSPCPRQVCRHGGWIGAPGELLVCLPNEVAIRVAGEDPDGPAAISR